MAGFFPIFFKLYWSADADVTESTFHLGLANSIASALLALTAPFLGAIADLGHHKRKFLGSFALLGVVATASLYWAGKGDWQTALLLYVFASIGFYGGNIFYDALLPTVSKRKNMDVISGFGYALGYLGGGILFALNVMMNLYPEWFGIPNRAEAVKLSMLTVAIWWFIFSIPVFLYVHEEKVSAEEDLVKLMKNGWRRLVDTFLKIVPQRKIFIFLLGYLFYIDGVNTTIKMAVDYGMALGFEQSHLIKALLITQFVGFPSAIFFGYLGKWWSPKAGIFVALGVYIAATIYAHSMTTSTEFYALAITIGLVQGGVQALSRSLFASMIPHDMEGEYFGFFNMVGKASAIAGPLLVSWVSVTTGDPRSSILVILLFFIVGGSLLFLHDRFKQIL